MGISGVRPVVIFDIRLIEGKFIYVMRYKIKKLMNFVYLY